MLYTFIGFAFSLLYSYYILPVETEHKPLIRPTIYPIMWCGMIIIPITQHTAIHIHHYIIYFFILVSNIYYQIPSVILGFSFGLFIQGILYKDCLKLLCRNPYQYPSKYIGKNILQH